MMIIRQSIYILSIITREMGKLKTQSPAYCIGYVTEVYALKCKMFTKLWDNNVWMYMEKACDYFVYSFYEYIEVASWSTFQQCDASSGIGRDKAIYSAFGIQLEYRPQAPCLLSLRKQHGETRLIRHCTNSLDHSDVNHLKKKFNDWCDLCCCSK